MKPLKPIYANVAKKSDTTEARIKHLERLEMKKRTTDSKALRNFKTNIQTGY